MRARLGLSLSALARALGMSRNTLAGYEAGVRPVPRVVWLAMLALWHRLDDG